MFKKFLFSASAILSVGTIFSYALGAVRDLVFARFFGVSSLTDLYLAAFLLPDFLLIFFITSALSGLVMPVFLREKNNQNTNVQNSQNSLHALHIFGNFFSSLLLIFSAVLLFFAVFAPFFWGNIFPQLFAKHPEELIFLGRCFLLTNFFFAFSNFLGSFLMMEKRFFSTAFAPVLYNIGIIAGIFFLAENQNDISSAAYGAVLGSVLHFLLRLFEYFFASEKFPLVLPFWHSTLKEIFVSMPWKSASLLLVPVLPFLVSLFALHQDGLFTAFQYFRNLQSAPIAIFATAIATASFPLLSAALAEKNEQKFVEIFQKNLEKIVFWAVPSTVGVFFMGNVVLSVLYGIETNTNAFVWISFFAVFLGISIVFESVFQLLSRAFFAGEDVKTPLFAGILFLGLFSSSVFVLQFWLHFPVFIAISISYLLSYAMQTVFLMKKFQKNHPLFSMKHVMKNSKNVFFASSIMGIFLFSVPFTFFVIGFSVKFVWIMNIVGIFLHSASAALIFFGVLFLLKKFKS